MTSLSASVRLIADPLSSTIVLLESPVSAAPLVTDIEPPSEIIRSDAAPELTVEVDTAAVLDPEIVIWAVAVDASIKGASAAAVANLESMIWTCGEPIVVGTFPGPEWRLCDAFVAALMRQGAGRRAAEKLMAKMWRRRQSRRNGRPTSGDVSCA